MERHDNQDFATQVFMRKNFYNDSFENSNALESRYVYNKRYIWMAKLKDQFDLLHF